MAENKEYITQQESAGAIQISEDVVASIATAAALETEGVSAMMGPTSGDLKPARKMSAKGVVIEPEEDGLSITLYVMIRFGFAMAEVAMEATTSSEIWMAPASSCWVIYSLFSAIELALLAKNSYFLFFKSIPSRKEKYNPFLSVCQSDSRTLI